MYLTGFPIFVSRESTFYMQYSLPNGKVIYLSVEDYLSLTDQDIQELMACNAGQHMNNPFTGSVIKGEKRIVTDDEEEEEDLGVDYSPEDDETDTSGPLNIHDIPDEESDF